MKKFDDWNFVKKATDAIGEKVYFKERDIFWTRVRENIGFEQNGKGKEFQRPLEKGVFIFSLHLMTK